jgi:hypothetical protein
MIDQDGRKESEISIVETARDNLAFAVLEEEHRN